MKIRIVMCLKNEKFMQRFLEYYENHFEKLEKFDLHMFSSKELAAEYVNNHNLDIFLLDEKYEMEDFITGKYLCAYLVEEKSLDLLDGIKTFCIYQKAESLFSELFNYFADSVEDRKYKFNSDRAKMILFQNAGGGTGCTTVAAACAYALASNGKKVLHLNLEKITSGIDIFWGEGGNDLDEILYAVKSNPENCVMKILASITQDKRGVYFIRPSKNILSMGEMTVEDIKVLLTTLIEECDFEYVVVDCEFGVSDCEQTIMRMADKIVFVLLANETSQKKFLRIQDALRVIDEQHQTDVLENLSVIFNKYDETQKILEGNTWNIIGGFPIYEKMDITQIVANLSKMKLLRKLL